jgi:hypothetical protein
LELNSLNEVVEMVEEWSGAIGECQPRSGDPI